MNNITPTLHGWVKWYNAKERFGFVVSHNSNQDILLPATVLENFGQSSASDGSPIVFEVRSGKHGDRVARIHSIGVPLERENTIHDDILLTTTSNGTTPPLRPARVKWFCESKGFGFANEFSSNADVFLHIDVLRKCGLSTLSSGEAISLRVITAELGAMASEIFPWDHILRNSRET